MLQPVMHKLANSRIVLASGSPRRRLILSNVGVDCEVVPSTYEENLDKSVYSNPIDYVKETARQKTLEVANRLSSDQRLPDLVIGADTVVTMGGKIFEKPRDKNHAFEMLTGFSGRNHVVYTGVVLLRPQPGMRDSALPDAQRFHITQLHEATEVWFAKLSPDVIRAYVETGEPMDKAGGYGIQAAGGTLVEKIVGDYFNVMGFPLHRFARTLLELYTEELAS